MEIIKYVEITQCLHVAGPVLVYPLAPSQVVDNVGLGDFGVVFGPSCGIATNLGMTHAVKLSIATSNKVKCRNPNQTGKAHCNLPFRVFQQSLGVDDLVCL